LPHVTPGLSPTGKEDLAFLQHPIEVNGVLGARSRGV
jgi:hypothetical protein